MCRLLLAVQVVAALSSPGGSCSRDSRIKIHAHGKQSRLLFIMFVDVTYIETLLDVTYIETYPISSSYMFAKVVIAVPVISKVMPRAVVQIMAECCYILGGTVVSYCTLHVLVS